MTKMLKAKCPICEEVVDYPDSDKTVEVRFNIIQNDSWKKYHTCKKQSSLESFK